MTKNLASFVQESFDELLYAKRQQMRNGFGARGEKALCLVPRRQFSEFLQRIFTSLGHSNYHNSPKPCIEYMGFILVDSDVDEIMFCIEI